MRKYLVILTLFFSCSMENVTVETISVKGKALSNEDLESIQEKVIKGGNNLTVSFINNPISLNSSDKIILYFNKEVAYFGEFKDYFSSEIPKNLKDSQIVHFKLIVLKEVSSVEVSQYIIQNKSVCYWDNDFKYLYIGFFPTNEENDRINFFPQKNTVVQ